MTPAGLFVGSLRGLGKGGRSAGLVACWGVAAGGEVGSGGEVVGGGGGARPAGERELCNAKVRWPVSWWRETVLDGNDSSSNMS